MGFGINKGMNDIPAFGGVVVNYGVLVQPEEAFPDPPPTWRNTKRRTWTPELHAKFIQALGLLGGPEGSYNITCIPYTYIFILIYCDNIGD